MTPKSEFLDEMNTLQGALDGIRGALLNRFQTLLKDQKLPVLIKAEHQELVWIDEGGVLITEIIDDTKVIGETTDVGDRFEIDLADLGIDDIKVILESLANEIYE